MSPISSSEVPQTRRWAVIQLNAGNDPEANLSRALQLVQEAAKTATLVALPEFFLVRGHHDTILDAAVDDDSEVIERLSRTAENNRTNLLAGSVPAKVSGNHDEANRCYNRSILFDTDGRVVTKYDKIHRFDVELDNGPTVRESGYLKPGKTKVTADVDGLRAGLSICYDLRFPELFQSYADEAVEVLFVPSNFTRETGRAHWLPLLRARAIENQCYVVAPNQIGENPETGVVSLGQSCLIDPWGKVIACCPDRETWASAALDRAYLHQVRRELPSLTHRRQTPESL